MTWPPEGTIRILDHFTRASWHRKIGDGPWEEMDLTQWHGKPPVFIAERFDWAVTETIEADNGNL